MRTDSHSITGTLGATYEIRKAIPRLRAEKIMRECIGSYTGAAVVYQRLSDDGKTGLYLTAEASDTTRRDVGRVEQKQPVRPEAQKSEAQKSIESGATLGEPVKMKEKKEAGPPFFIGYVNLETGKCIKAQGIRG
ncbi:MAG: hypothetical protein H7Z38_04600 [Rubrivivax sp.]|nr:hypothetical protein [Pyrinomonadaceae bacterium]